VSRESHTDYAIMRPLPRSQTTASHPSRPCAALPSSISRKWNLRRLPTSPKADLGGIGDPIQQHKIPITYFERICSSKTSMVSQAKRVRLDIKNKSHRPSLLCGGLACQDQICLLLLSSNCEDKPHASLYCCNLSLEIIMRYAPLRTYLRCV
jgi:hypothetical protein